MGNCNLIVWGSTAPKYSREAYYWGKNSWSVSPENLQNFMIHNYINNTHDNFIFIILYI